MLVKFVDENFPLWAKILLCLFFDASAIYRIFHFVDDCIDKKQDKNYLALVAGILLFSIPFVGFIMGIIDIIYLVNQKTFAPIFK